ncbi:hypothetical protein TWF102_003936 [Orbilia oligospora]|uniref:Uncharacterized protein n=1 Tax=Orbilia oligospora TaxID=2813651 RepID=A0A7C8NA94_ORBOL|nr:hypothetical protein TWF102_003936 [Orbilia oligospora]
MRRGGVGSDFSSGNFTMLICSQTARPASTASASNNAFHTKTRCQSVCLVSRKVFRGASNFSNKISKSGIQRMMNQA